MITCYVAGPFSGPDRAANVARAVEAGRELGAAGLLPLVAHVAIEPLVEHLPPAERYEAAMVLCLGLVGRCDCLLRLPGASPGADREAARACDLGLPVFGSAAEVLAWVCEGAVVAWRGRGLSRRLRRWGLP